MHTSELKEEMNKDISKLVPASVKQGKEVVIDKNNLPLNIVYKGKRYVLLLTKNDKLILNKSID